MSETVSVLDEFLTESYENLDQLDRHLVALEANPSPEILGSIFRIIHTVKGTCGFLGFSRLEALTHVGEGLLCRLRDGRLQPTTEITAALLSMVDVVRKMLGSIESSGSEGSVDGSELMATMRRIQESSAPPLQQPAAVSPPPMPRLEKALPAAPRLEKALPAAPAGAREPDPRDGRADGLPGDRGGERPERESHRGTGVQEAVEPSPPAHQAGPAVCGAADGSIRVDVRLLDKLMNLVGELVLARNQILQLASRLDGGTWAAPSQQLDLITTELQEGIMKTRMQPLATLWDKLPRVVRDLAVACGKRVRLEAEGKETDLDKTIIEAIKDPLTHLVRNAVDHGIETPELRIARGKPPEGRLRLSAYHEGGQVILEISDDGGGIDPERIRQEAVRHRLISPGQADRLTDRELVNLIFLPGFSTAERITRVSGRGVGMDVVRTNIEKIGGTIDVQSQPGRGTRVRVKIPLTLTIIQALIVASRGERYAIPQVSLLELVRLESGHGKGVESVFGAPVYRLRGELLPLVYLNRELRLEEEPEPQGSGGVLHIIVLEAAGRRFGLVVDAIHNTEEIVVKPLGQHLKGLATFAGATILDDGRVALILDVLGLAQRGGVVPEVPDRAVPEGKPVVPGPTRDRRRLLLADADPKRRIAIPVASIARIEEIPLALLEWTGGHPVVQHRGQIMPLVQIAAGPGLNSDQPLGDPLRVLIHEQSGRPVGVVVSSIVDIVEWAVPIEPQAGAAAGIGPVIIQGRVTELVDLPALVATALLGSEDRPGPARGDTRGD